jgi:hypothetical protein
VSPARDRRRPYPGQRAGHPVPPIGHPAASPTSASAATGRGSQADRSAAKRRVHPAVWFAPALGLLAVPAWLAIDVSPPAVCPAAAAAVCPTTAAEPSRATPDRGSAEPAPDPRLLAAAPPSPPAPGPRRPRPTIRTIRLLVAGLLAVFRSTSSPRWPHASRTRPCRFSPAWDPTFSPPFPPRPALRNGSDHARMRERDPVFGGRLREGFWRLR